jgi:hypothetical protein
MHSELRPKINSNCDLSQGDFWDVQVMEPYIVVVLTEHPHVAFETAFRSRTKFLFAWKSTCRWWTDATALPRSELAASATTDAFILGLVPQVA